MTGVKPPLHGRDHLLTGSDPIPGLSTSSGLQFNSGTYGSLNVGDWLNVSTSGASSGIGISLVSNGGQFFINASGNTTQINGGTINLQSSGGMSLLTFGGSTSLFLLSNANSGVAGIQARLLNHGAYFMISDNTPTVQFQCTPQATTGVITISDSSGNAIFRVDNNGDLHGKTGKALTFDL